MASPVPISLLSKPCFSLQQSAGFFDFFSHTLTGTLCCGSQEVAMQGEHPGSAGGKMGYAEVTISAEKNVC